MDANAIDRRTFLRISGLMVGGVSLAAFAAGCATDAKSQASSGSSRSTGPAAGSTSRNSVTAGAQGVSDLSLQLAWLGNVQSAGEIAALDRGYYHQHGLNATLRAGGPNANPVSLVAGKNSLVGIAYAPALMLARSQGIPVKCFGAAMQKAPLAYFSLKEKNITSVAQYKGKKVGIQVGGEPLLSALLQTGGLKLSDVNVVKVGSDATPLVTGQVDIIAAWVINLEQLKPITAAGKQYNYQTLWDNGVRFQSNFYFARDDVITSHKEELMSFLNAVSQGWAWAIDNPDPAYQLVAKFAPGLDAAAEKEELTTLLPGYVYGPNTKTNGFGWMDRSVWQSALDLYSKLGLLKAPVAVDDIATWDILNAATERTKR